MWIAKPIQALSQDELRAWCLIEHKVPLSQTLAWAYAIEAISGKAYLVFNPQEQVGGMVFSTPQGNHQSFECVNGPILDWDNPQNLPRQLATFAMAVSKLNKNFASLTLKPRWTKENLQKRLSILPIPVASQSEAATMVIPIRKSEETQFSALTPRLRRTLTHTLKNNVQVDVQEITSENLISFHEHLNDFGQNRGFIVPPISWFKSLIQSPNQLGMSHLKFQIIRSSKCEQDAELSQTQILVCQKDSQAFYLFGYEKRANGLKASLSTSASAHWKALQYCSTLGIESYDLNGYVIDADPQHPYYGVCKFKDQFAGELVRYVIPELEIHL